jgi:hypothetical protein
MAFMANKNINMRTKISICENTIYMAFMANSERIYSYKLMTKNKNPDEGKRKEQ